MRRWLLLFVGGCCAVMGGGCCVELGGIGPGFSEYLSRGVAIPLAEHAMVRGGNRAVTLIAYAGDFGAASYRTGDRDGIPAAIGGFDEFRYLHYVVLDGETIGGGSPPVDGDTEIVDGGRVMLWSGRLSDAWVGAAAVERGVVVTAGAAANGSELVLGWLEERGFREWGDVGTDDAAWALRCWVRGDAPAWLGGRRAGAFDAEG